jgi:Type I restriction-modification system methyltransferase subunit
MVNESFTTMPDGRQVVQRLWNYCNVLRDDGVSYGDYVEQLTYLLFLKMADEQTKPPFNKPSIIPKGYDWPSLLQKDGDALEAHYRHILETLGKGKGMLGVIFRKSQNKIQDPAKLRRLLELINVETWVGMDIDVKGEIYEGLLQKNAEDTKSGAGQYFTLRPLIKAMVEVIRPEPGMTIYDPACGTGGFLLAAHDYLVKNYKLDKGQKKFLKFNTFRGKDIVDNVARLCVMNLYLHGIGGDPPAPRSMSLESGKWYVYILECADGSLYKGSTNSLVRRITEHEQGKVSWTKTRLPVTLVYYENFDNETEARKREHDLKTGFGRKWLQDFLASRQAGESPIEVGDALISEPPGDRFDMVLTNPPFGKKSSITIVNGEGKADRESLIYERQDFWATTSNKQLNFLQHVKTILKINGKAAIVVPDNVLFEGGAGETVRKKLLHECDVHTLLRLPTGIFYAQGVKANVLFFDRKPASEKPWTEKLWIYDLRTNVHFTLKTNTLRFDDLRDFISGYHAKNRFHRKETERFRSFTYAELMQRDKISLDIFWLKDESLEDSENLPDPALLARDIMENLESALEQFGSIYTEIEGN